MTAESFKKKAMDFMRLNGTGYVAALKPYPGFPADEKFQPTPRQWGAWVAYFSRLKYKTKGIQARGYATVPAEWPHDFDAEASIQGDHQAADAFEAHLRDERERQTFLAGSIVNRSSNALAYWRDARRTMMQPRHKPPVVETAPPVDISDFPDGR